jgi:O-antigen/teichoic acid export membrane protein
VTLGTSTDRPPLLVRERGLRGGLADRIFVTASTLMRMGVGLAVFVMLARLLGPVQFGLFSTVFAYAMLAGFITDFGNAIKTLRDIAADPASGGQALSQALTIKVLLTGLVSLAGALVIAFLPVSGAVKVSCAVLSAAVLIGSVAELAQVAFRSLGRYRQETWIVFWTSLVHGAILLVVALAHPTILAVACAFLVSRGLYLAIAVVGVARLFPAKSLRPPGLGQTLAALKASRTWALDAGLGYLSVQIDGLVVAHMLGLGPAGIYQSGNRFAQSAMGLGVILTNIHVPRLAAKVEAGNLRTEWLMVMEFVAVGVLFAAAMVIGGPWVTRYLLGPEYKEVDRLWLGFGVFIAARLIATAFGGALSARGQAGMRVMIQLVSLTAIVGGLWLTLPRFGIEAAPWTMAAGGFITMGLYAAAFTGLFDTKRRDDPH